MEVRLEEEGGGERRRRRRREEEKEEEERGSSHSEFSGRCVFSLVAARISDLFEGSYAVLENCVFNVHFPETHGP